MAVQKRTVFPSKSETRAALETFIPLLGGLAFISGVINLLSLTGPLFMLQVYDRVLTSHSIPTLVALSIGVLFLYVVQGLIDYIRALIVSRSATDFHERLGARVYSAISTLPLAGNAGIGDAMQALRDLDAVRSFIASNGPSAFLDVPWMPVYLGLIYLLNPLLAYVTFCAALILALLTLASDTVNGRLNQDAAIANARRMLLAESGYRNAEIIKSMGLGERFANQFSDANIDYLDHLQRTTDRSNTLSEFGRVLRLAIQSGILALGAYGVLRGEMSGGSIIAASITSARALTPLEGIILHWKGFIAARSGMSRLDLFLARLPKQKQIMKLPAPKTSLIVSGLYLAPPGEDRPVLKNISLGLNAGQSLAIIGPSAAGKSCLARALAGVWKPAGGEIRLDGARLDQWHDEVRGQFTGYLPQDVELFDSTIANNIARFDPEAASEHVIEAAKSAAIHDMILSLPHGYETRIGEGGMALSAGQRQRIGLARALFGNPFLLVLDEPNSNLDAAGEAALMTAIKTAKQRGGLVVIIAHRSAVMADIDKVAVLDAGQLRAFGARDDVLRQLKSGEATYPSSPYSVKLATARS